MFWKLQIKGFAVRKLFLPTATAVQKKKVELLFR